MLMNYRKNSEFKPAAPWGPAPCLPPPPAPSRLPSPVTVCGQGSDWDVEVVTGTGHRKPFPQSHSRAPIIRGLPAHGLFYQSGRASA